jgi:hypothetical protein
MTPTEGVIGYLPFETVYPMTPSVEASGSVVEQWALAVDEKY